MKLDIGSGRKPRKGFQTIDVEEYANPTYLGDFRDMTFKDVDEIRMNYLFEHFGREDSVRVLKQLHSWLRVGGVLDIATPDFEGICKNFHRHPYWMTRHAFGSQEAGWAFHLDGWYEEKYKRLYPIIGFNILSIRHYTTRRYLPNIQVVAEKFDNPKRDEQLAYYERKYPHGLYK